MLRSSRTAWLALVSLVVLAGCVAAPDTSHPSSTGELPAHGPLEEHIGWAQQVVGVSGLIERMTLEASRTAECMSRQGFEYYPAIPAAEDIEELPGLERGTREFVERYGYGLWTEVKEHAGVFSYADAPNPEGQAYLASLSETAREAYNTALWGEIVSQRGGTTHREGGCAELAQVGIPADDEFLTSVRDEALAYLESLPTDPAFAELDAQWSECVAGEGLSFRSPHGARDSFAASVMAYFEEGDHGGVEPLATPYAQERAAEEKRVAIADLECRESLDYDRQHTLIAHELQERYVSDHRADLDLIAEALGG